MPSYSEKTRQIEVSVEPVFLEDQSCPSENKFFWAYHIRIENRSAESVQLRTRQWRITDSTGRFHEVTGAGVGGVEPFLRPGDSFEYTSGTPLNSPSGIMMGSYCMETLGGERFDVAIPAFSLDSPHETGTIN